MTIAPRDYRAYNIEPPIADPEASLPCHGKAGEFFDDDDCEMGERRLAREHRARVLCRTCPFIQRCGEHGLEHEDYGVWGGMSERDRKAVGGRGIAPKVNDVPRDVVRRMARAGIATEHILAMVEHGRRIAERERGVA